jgi:glycosyltransferase involved in cell wall biosynthesis
MRVMPAVLKGHAQARLVVVGDGPLLWPLRVMSRYMLLDYAVRVTGHIGGREVRELVAAADIMAVPSRASTEDWQILSAWSARRPVVAARVAADGLCREGEDSLLIEPEAASLLAALGHVLADPELARRLGESGHRKVRREFGGPCAEAGLA